MQSKSIIHLIISCSLDIHINNNKKKKKGIVHYRDILYLIISQKEIEGLKEGGVWFVGVAFRQTSEGMGRNSGLCSS